MPMKKRLLTAALAACLSLVAPACAPQGSAGGNSASGSVGISRDDALVYAADGDLDTLFVIDAKTQQVQQAIKVGRQPEKVLVGPDDTVDRKSVV
jgi:YVTN family beta-propeller protein